MEQSKNDRGSHPPGKKKGSKKPTATTSLITPTIPSAAKVFMTNLYRIKLLGSEEDPIQRYLVSFDPDIPEVAFPLRSRILKKAQKQLEKPLGHFILRNGLIYARKKCDTEIAIPVEHDNITYQIKARWTNEIKCGEQEHHQYLNIFLKDLFGCLRLQKIGNKYFDPLKSEPLNLAPTGGPPANLNLWPGYSALLHETEAGAFLRLDVAHRVAQKEPILYEIKMLAEMVPKEESPETYVNSVMRGKFVYSLYNNIAYRVDGVDFSQSPKSTFTNNKGEKTTYADYLLKKYNVKVADMDQPLLVHYKERSKNKEEIRLVPELCSLTGITESMRKDSFLMKDIAQKSSLSPQLRIKSCKELLDTLTHNKQCQALKESWKISIEDYPQIVEGARLTAGKLVMQALSSVQAQSPYDYIDLDECKNLDRETQRPMLNTPSLQRWGIYYDSSFEDHIGTFKKELKDALTLYKVQHLAPIILKVNSGDVDEWLSLASKVPPDAQAIILVIKSDKGKAGILYDTLKHYFIVTRPIPSQFVLSRTIERGKNLRSICCKIVVQLCSKLGGIPWEITDAPLVQFPIMVAGITLSEFDTSPARTASRVLTLVTTLNKGLSRHFSAAKILSETSDVSSNLKDLFARALASYKATNKCYPKLLIVYKECLTGKEQQAINVEEDTSSIKKVLEAAAVEAAGGADVPATGETCKLVYILAKERCGMKFYEGLHSDDLRNPMPGCIVSQKVARKDKKEFFLISQRTPQGFSIPTHYFVGYADEYKAANNLMDSIIGLTYKLCYLYYNVSGPVRVPAPLQYSGKLNKLLFQRANVFSPPPTPDQRLENLNIMYYL